MTITELAERVRVLEAEADIRRLQARYMFLCDTPCPEFGVEDDSRRIDLILDLYTEDAVWEGVGEYYDGQFGRAEGKAAIRTHFEQFWCGKADPALLLNAHYLTSEQIRVDGGDAEGQWIHVQPWLFSDGRSLLRSSRLNNAFRRVDGQWLISRTRTENVFVAPLPDSFAEAYPRQSVLLKP
ncbi:MULTISPECIES: nuclear transport factor 2 family protein [unclassified Rhodococcus (in: high G+C Gram-positive bacteria)]|uniref:nuclear transport factor 2 family protein n=1 Tax=unclassified Rhodococcus (in: high G+C Gram-positive bacteria) TaxID=192944 RepID=UPI00096ABEB5|nr:MULTISPECIES: nuclear transport factor 2 family protein [unclassified Rhodococcus (in: high G+C Gram-positive bacteria)]